MHLASNCKLLHKGVTELAIPFYPNVGGAIAIAPISKEYAYKLLLSPAPLIPLILLSITMQHSNQTYNLKVLVHAVRVLTVPWLIHLEYEFPVPTVAQMIN